MKPFVMDRKMRTLGGAFYPTGWVVVMVQAHDVDRLGEELAQQTARPEDVLHLAPEVLMRELGGSVGESDLPLPSVGTEGQSVRKYLALARQGLHGLMVHGPGRCRHRARDAGAAARARGLCAEVPPAGDRRSGIGPKKSRLG